MKPSENDIKFMNRQTKDARNCLAVYNVYNELNQGRRLVQFFENKLHLYWV